MIAKRITISLETSKDGKVPFNYFRTALDGFVGMLNDVGLELSEHKLPKLSWEIADLSLSSATISIESAYKDNADFNNKIFNSAINGLESLEQKKIRPQYFNNDALEKVKQVTNIIGDKIPRINIYTDIPGQQFYITKSIAANTQAILEYIEFIGSVEGFLEVLYGHEGKAPYFQIKDVISKAKVICYFPEEMLEQALKYFRKRVLVSGLIKCDIEGKPRTIKVRNIELIPSDENLPQPEDVRGIMKGQISNISIEHYLEEHFGNEKTS